MLYPDGRDAKLISTCKCMTHELLLGYVHAAQNSDWSLGYAIWPAVFIFCIPLVTQWEELLMGIFGWMIAPRLGWGHTRGFYSLESILVWIIYYCGCGETFFMVKGYRCQCCSSVHPFIHTDYFITRAMYEGYEWVTEEQWIQTSSRGWVCVIALL